MKNQLIRVIAAVAALWGGSMQASADIALPCQDLAIRTFQAAHRIHAPVITRVRCEAALPASAENGNPAESSNQSCMVQTSSGYNVIVTLNSTCDHVISFEQAL